MKKTASLTYAATGVNYSEMDPVKRLAQQQGKATAGNLHSTGATEVTESRGESAYVWAENEVCRAFVMEGLGTKNLVADAMRVITGKTYYDHIAQDTVAMIVNDLITVGAKPQVVTAYFAIGNSAWLNDQIRASDLINGWAAACQLAGAAWGGGETPTLKGIVDPSTIDLAGSCVGIIQPKERLILGDRLAAGDAIVLIESSGIHANGLTLARAIAEKLPDGYKTLLSDGMMYGEALLQPTHIYAKCMEALFTAGIDLHYSANITGHGWRKIMRANREFSYVMNYVPQPQPLFDLIQQQSGTSDEEMYGNFNMGAGFALYLPAAQAKKALKIIGQNGFQAWQAGKVTEGPKQVVIEPKKLVYQAESLGVR